jgi:hypothetical protein
VNLATGFARFPDLDTRMSWSVELNQMARCVLVLLLPDVLNRLAFLFQGGMGRQDMCGMQLKGQGIFPAAIVRHCIIQGDVKEIKALERAPSTSRLSAESAHDMMGTCASSRNRRVA